MTEQQGVRTAFVEGLRRVRRAPALVAGVWASTLAIALPAAIVLREQLAAHLGDSLAAGSAVRGVNFDWWNEFLAQAAGLGQSFVPAILGFAAVLDNVSRVADARGLETSLAVLVAAQMALAWFLTGGIIDRLFKDQPVGPGPFFAACGVWMVRLLPLVAVSAVLYGALFAWLHPWLFDVVYPHWTRDMTEERLAFAARVTLYAVFAAIVCAVNVWVDYTKIHAVAGGRGNLLDAGAAAARFMARRPLAVAGLYTANLGFYLSVAAVYFLLAPGASAPLLLTLVIGQAYIVLRGAVRLQFVASQTVLAAGGSTPRADTAES